MEQDSINAYEKNLYRSGDRICHNGDIGICKDLINAAKSAGCDAIKLPKDLLIKYIVRIF